MSKTAKRYANALFSLCQSDKEKEAMKSDLDQFKKWVYGSTELRSIVSNPLLPKSQLKDLIEEILMQAKASKTFRNGIHYIIDNGRMRDFEDIIKEFDILYMNHKGMSKATVFTVTELDKSDQDQFLTYLEDKFSQKLTISFKTDPTLIGGFKAIVGSKLIDSSLKTKLFNLRRTLKGAS